jgi:hypothetical protein
MTVVPKVEVDTSKLSEENVKNFKKEETPDPKGKKWVKS